MVHRHHHQAVTFNFREALQDKRKQEEQTQRKPRTRLTKKTTLKESSREDTDTPREEVNMRPLIIPSKNRNTETTRNV